MNENHIFLVGVHQGGLDLLVKCPHTGKETNIHAEVNFMNVPNGSTDVSGITQAMNIPVSPTVNNDSVTDKDVMDVRQALKKTGSVEDLFGDKDNS